MIFIPSFMQEIMDFVIHAIAYTYFFMLIAYWGISVIRAVMPSDAPRKAMIVPPFRSFWALLVWGLFGAVLHLPLRFIS